MKHLSIVLVVVILIIAVACKKEKKPVLPEPVPSAPSIPSLYTPKMHKIWMMDGYSIYSQHPSDQDPDKTYTDTTLYFDKEMKIDVIDDTTILFNNQKFVCIVIDSLKGVLVYKDHVIPEASKASVSYYYKTDSIRYNYYNYGVSFTSIAEYHSK